MKTLQKHLLILILTVVLLCAAVYFTPKTDTPVPHFIIYNPRVSESQEIALYQAGDENCYVFLPSYADLEHVTVSLPKNHLYSLGDFPLSDGMNCGNFALETPYPFEIDHQKTATLWFFQSENVATMYLDTVSGNMNHLHQDKENKETVSVKLYTVDGINSFSDLQSSLTGRGNVTWEYDKRPYTLTLSADAALLDMPAAAKWVLLANAADETNLNNKVIFDLAKRMNFRWTPDTRWIDLYLNGEYNGLYMLTEKIEIHENRLPLDTASGDFLCRIDLNDRWSGLNYPFLTDAGRTVEITAPDILGPGILTNIENRVREMEQEILSGADLRNSSILDLDSWVRRYLIDEIFANIDSDLASCYFYSSDGKIYAGPLWDYDMTLGNAPRNQSPYAFIAKAGKKSDTSLSPYYSTLCNNASFCSRIQELYRAEFIPELQKLLNGELDVLIEHISKASLSNSLRWRSMYDNLPADVVHTTDALKDYLAHRVQFLNSAWLDHVPFCTIQFESSPGSSYLTISVEKGHYLESTYINTEQLVWVDSETGEIFDFSQPVTEDRILSRQTTESVNPDAQNSQTAVFSMKDLLVVALMAISLGAVAILASIDFVQRKK